MADRHHSLSSSIASLHGDEMAVGQPLNGREMGALGRTRVFVATGTVLMGIGALGAGARPVVPDPTFGVRLLNLPSRIQTVSLTMTTTGAVMMALAWLMLGRFALGKRRMSRGELDRTLLLWVLPLLIAPPMFSKDVYSYLAQSQICRLGLDPYRVGPATGLGLGHVFTLSVPSLWRGYAGALRAAVLVDRPRHLGADRRKHRRRGALPSAGGTARSGPDRLGDTAIGSPLRRRRGQRAVAGGGQPAADHASGRRHPQRGADARADADRYRVRVARYRLRAPAVAATLAAGQRRPGGLGAAGHAAGRSNPDRAVLADQAALAAGAGLRHDGVGAALRRHSQVVPAGQQPDGGIVAGCDGRGRLGQPGRGWVGLPARG